MNSDVNVIEIEVNNRRYLRVYQSAVNKSDHTITLESVNHNGEVDWRDNIDEGDFVMLMNYYRYTIDKNFKDVFINRDEKIEDDLCL